MQVFLIRVLSFLGLFIQFAQNMAMLVKNKVMLTVLILLVISLSYYPFKFFGEVGLLCYGGIIMVLTVVLSGLNKNADSLMDKIEEKKQKIEEQKK